MKRVLIAVAIVTLAAVQNLPARHVALQPQSVESTAANLVKAGLPGFRLATRADFIQELRDMSHIPPPTQTVLRADFDGDGREDWAVVVIGEKVNVFRLFYVLNLSTGNRYDFLTEQAWGDGQASRGVRYAMFLKRIGERGVAGRKYATILGDTFDPTDPKNDTAAIRQELAARIDEYVSVPAIEAWTGPARIDAKDRRNFPDAGIAYCSTTWYYRRNGTLAHFGACD